MGSDTEQPANLVLWFKNGTMMLHRGQGRGLPEVSIGRTDSERALGFTLTQRGRRRAAFVLDRPQIENLHAYLGRQIRRLKRSRWTTVNLARAARKKRVGRLKRDR